MALPGIWAQVPLADPIRVDALAIRIGEALAEAGLPDVSLDEALHDLARTGGDTAYLRLAGAQPTLLVTAWPEGSSGSAGLDGLRERAGDDDSLAVLGRADGYLCLRADRGQADGLSGRRYWICHPDSGRDLVIDVVFLGPETFPHEDELYDVLATHVTWVEEEADG